MKKNEKLENDKRILGRRVAREMSKDELHAVTGGTTSCSCGGPDDCDQQQV
ncbi:hypothetical protein [Paraliomyxa miuraensis]|uniref:hypothetical protein n=1 Tax=Paraliomyxa miuraensis TaxID=376150 RepID=UPI002256D99D|nr:hypothetical protein [Paraliomyxa miuraensis]MCX4240914.1 hypothetical protein [Paraliomyxa miuraensis]